MRRLVLLVSLIALSPACGMTDETCALNPCALKCVPACRNADAGSCSAAIAACEAQFATDGSVDGGTDGGH